MPGTYYCLNMMGMNLSDERMKQIPFPRLELTTHVTARCVQTGALAGTLAACIAPLVSRDQESDIYDRIGRYGMTGVKVGLIAGPLMTFAVAVSKSISLDGFYDRCFSLRYHAGQCMVDRCMVLGAVAGCGIASHKQKPRGVGLVLGITGGIVLGVVVNMARRA